MSQSTHNNAIRVRANNNNNIGSCNNRTNVIRVQASESQSTAETRRRTALATTNYYCCYKGWFIAQQRLDPPSEKTEGTATATALPPQQPMEQWMKSNISKTTATAKSTMKRSREKEKEGSSRKYGSFNHKSKSQ